MRRFEILDASRRGALPCAVLNWDERKDEFSIEIAKWAGEGDVPMLLAPFARKGQRRVDDAWARRWVAERVVPSSRQNLGQVLKANGLDGYEPMALLVAGAGRCAQDDFCIREIAQDDFRIREIGEKGEAAGDASARAGQAVREARVSAGKSQVELARSCGIAQSALSNLERGKGNPTLGLLSDVAAALGKELVVSFK